MTYAVVILSLALIAAGVVIFKMSRKVEPVVDSEAQQTVVEKNNAALAADTKIAENKAKIEALKAPEPPVEEPPKRTTEGMNDAEVAAELRRRGAL